MRRFLLLPLGLVLLMLPACRIKQMFDHATGSHDSVISVINDAAKDKYTPPADGHLTDGQVEMYIKVRTRAKEIAQTDRKQIVKDSDAVDNSTNTTAVAISRIRDLAPAADFMMSDLRAARDLKVNTSEYMWVKAQILAVNTSLLSKKMGQATDAGLNSSYQMIKKQYDEAGDPAMKKQLGDMLAGFQKQRQQIAPTTTSSAVEYNARLLSKYGDAVNVMTDELGKYETRDGEARQAMQQWQEGLNKAIDAAKK